MASPSDIQTPFLPDQVLLARRLEAMRQELLALVNLRLTGRSGGPLLNQTAQREATLWGRVVAVSPSLAPGATAEVQLVQYDIQPIAGAVGYAGLGSATYAVLEDVTPLRALNLPDGTLIKPARLGSPVLILNHETYWELEQGARAAQCIIFGETLDMGDCAEEEPPP